MTSNDSLFGLARQFQQAVGASQDLDIIVQYSTREISDEPGYITIHSTHLVKMTSWDIFSPSATFSDEMTEDPEEARISVIYSTAKTAMQKQSKVTVKAYDERFKAYVESIIDKEDGQLVNFRAYNINDTDLKLPRSYFTHDIQSIDHYESDDDSFDFTDLPNNQLALLGEDDDQQPSGLPDFPDTGKGYPLPIQADGETVDVDLMILRDYPAQEKISFHSLNGAKVSKSQPK
jgi:hypothetical protein